MIYIKRKICVVITARPSYSRIKTVLEAIKKNEKLELQLVVSGSALLKKFGKSIDFISDDGFKIDEQVHTVLTGSNPISMTKSTGIAVLELSTVFNKLNPDAVITVADRYETLATSIAAAYQNICLVHVQGGEVTGNIDEKVRHANTKLADIHFVSCRDAEKRVIKMGEDPKFVFNTGCPSIDLAAQVLKDPSLNFSPYDKYGGVGSRPDFGDGYIVVMQHPVTTEYEVSSVQINQTLKAIYELDKPTFWFWPNMDSGSDGTANGIRSFRENMSPRNIHFFKNMKPNDFLKLVFNSNCLIGNSSVGIRECSHLGVPVIDIGSRQNRRKRSENVLCVDYSAKEIISAYSKITKMKKPKPSKIYGSGNSGDKIAKILESVELISHKTICY